MPESQRRIAARRLRILHALPEAGHSAGILADEQRACQRFDQWPHRVRRDAHAGQPRVGQQFDGASVRRRRRAGDASCTPVTRAES
jgi:hypothetical protein